MLIPWAPVAPHFPIRKRGLGELLFQQRTSGQRFGSRAFRIGADLRGLTFSAVLEAAKATSVSSTHVLVAGLASASFTLDADDLEVET